MVFIIVIVAIIIVFIVLGTLIEGDPSDSKTVKYERPKTKPIFSEKVNIDRKESNAKRIFDPCSIDFEVKGTNFRTNDEIRAARFLEKGDTLVLVSEPDNAVDPNAVKVYNINGVHIGYVQKNLSAFVFERIDHVESCKVKNVSKHNIPFTGSSRKSGAWILRKVLNLWHENRRCNMDVPARGHGRAI